MRISKSVLVLSFCALIGLAGCGKNTPESVSGEINSGGETSVESRVEEYVGKTYSIVDVRELLNEDVDYNGKAVEVKSLLEGEHYYYACVDVCGTPDEEIGLLSGRFMYVIDPENKKVIYEGTNYESLANCDGKRGIIYRRLGGAPKHIDYQFWTFDENNSVNEESTWSIYDVDSDSQYDEHDLYYFKGEETEYEKWKELTEEYVELGDKSDTWLEFFIVDNDKLRRMYKDAGNDFEEAFKSVINLADGEMIDKIDTLEYGKCYRVSVQRTEEVPGEHIHLRDYFFVKTDKIKWFMVDYPSKQASKDSDRYVYSEIMDYESDYVDITNDGKKDITIYLGNKERYVGVSCAYIYKDGEFVYEKSYESIPDPWPSEQEGIIRGGDYKEGYHRYVYENGVFVQHEDIEGIDDPEFKTFVESNVTLMDGEYIYWAWWLEPEKVYRVATQRIVDVDDEYRHLRDFFFVKNNPYTWFVVDYPSKKDSPKADRYVWDACGFEAKYEDVTFDGNKDIIINLGYGGLSVSDVHCAYIYKDGEYVYNKSFEDILGYSVNEEEGCIDGWFRDGPDHYVQRAVYKNDVFVVEQHVEEEQ